MDNHFTGKPIPAKLTRNGVLVLLALFALLAAAIVYAVRTWTNIDAQMTGWGWGMLILGIVMSVVVGVGLSFLVFYSAKHDMDR